MLTFKYLRQYRSRKTSYFLSLEFSYGISERYAIKIFHKIRLILADVVELKNSDKLKYEDIEKVIVDIRVQPIKRPTKNQELHYNGSKKSHIIKTQIIINQQDNSIQQCETKLQGRKSDGSGRPSKNFLKKLP